MSTPSPPRWCWIAVAILLGCPRGSSSRSPGEADDEGFDIQQPFPTQASIDEMLASPPPDGLERPAPADIAEWTMVGVVPETIGDEPLVGGDDNQRVAVEVLTKAGLRPTGALMCYAQQWASFVGAHDGYPPPDIDDFMRSRCGHAARGVRMRHQVYDDQTDPRLQSPRDDAVILGAFANEKDRRVGFWAGALADGRVVAAWAVADDGGLQVEPRAMAATDGAEVHVRGVLPWRPEWIIASVTRGKLGASTCRPWEERGKGEGAFAYACPIDPDDPSALVEVSAAPPGKLLGYRMVQMLLSPDGSLPRTYTAPTLELPVAPDDRSNAAHLAGVNHLRRELNAAPLVLSAAQSHVLTNLVPYLHAADERAVLGALAGWRVEGVVRDANLGSRVVPARWSVERELAALLMYPTQRERLLDPRMDVLASGSREHEGAVETLDVVYELFDQTEFVAEENAFFYELDWQRAQVGQPPVVRVSAEEDLVVLDESARRIREHEATPRQALQQLAAYFAEATGRTFYTYSWAPMRIEGWRPEFPEEMFTNAHVAAAAKISYFRPPGAAWGQHVVLMVFTILDGPMK